MPMVGLSPQEAGDITRMLLEFESLNHKRQLVDDLLAKGVTLEKFVEFSALASNARLGVNEPLKVDVQNLMAHLKKGLDLNGDRLHRHPQSAIVNWEQKAVACQEAALAKRQLESSPPSSPWEVPQLAERAVTRLGTQSRVKK